MKRLAAFMLAAAAWPTVACRLDGGPHNHFTAAYPGSIDAALATHDLVQRGLVEPLPPVTPEDGRQRSEPRVQALVARWPASEDRVSLLLVEAGVWSRWVRIDGRLELATDVGGPVSGDAVVITSEAVLAALLAGQLSVADALDAQALRVSHIERLGAWMRVFGLIGSPKDVRARPRTALGLTATLDDR